VHSLMGSLMYCLLAVWLAMHGSISAQSYMTRMLTQTIRLPIASLEQIEEARATLEEYETDVKTGFRLPFVQVCRL